MRCAVCLTEEPQGAIFTVLPAMRSAMWARRSFLACEPTDEGGNG
jgi:hypothetical protein